jgi:hypothetical protein
MGLEEGVVVLICGFGRWMEWSACAGGLDLLCVCGTTRNGLGVDLLRKGDRQRGNLWSSMNVMLLAITRSTLLYPTLVQRSLWTWKAQVTCSSMTGLHTSSLTLLPRT